MKKHNGGAATILCNFLDDTSNKDYYHSSTFINLWILIETLQPLNDPIEDLYDPGILY